MSYTLLMKCLGSSADLRYIQQPASPAGAFLLSGSSLTLPLQAIWAVSNYAR